MNGRRQKSPHTTQGKGRNIHKLNTVKPNQLFELAFSIRLAKESSLSSVFGCHFWLKFVVVVVVVVEEEEDEEEQGNGERIFIRAVVAERSEERETNNQKFVGFVVVGRL